MLVRKSIPDTVETYDALTYRDDGTIAFLGVDPDPQKPGYSGYLVPFYVLTDRGSFFVPGSAKKTVKEQKDRAPVLYQHDTWEPIGVHTDAREDDQGMWINTHINESVPRGAEVMSNLRFGVPMGISIGYDRIADRSGNEKDDALLDRKTAPATFKDVPVNELRAITEFRWWESSPVTFPGIGTARPSEVRSASPLDAVEALTAALKAGSLTEDQGRTVRQLVEAYEEFAAAGEAHSTNGQVEGRPDRQSEIALAMIARARLLAEEIPA